MALRGGRISCECARAIKYAPLASRTRAAAQLLLHFPIFSPSPNMTRDLLSVVRTPSLPRARPRRADSKGKRFRSRSRPRPTVTAGLTCACIVFLCAWGKNLSSGHLKCRFLQIMFSRWRVGGFSSTPPSEIIDMDTKSSVSSAAKQGN